MSTQPIRRKRGGMECGAANRTRTCDPVITNDVLYQLSYCGGPGVVGTLSKAPAPDIGRTAILQEKRWHSPCGSAAPARQETAPAAGLALHGVDRFCEFV